MKENSPKTTKTIINNEIKKIMESEKSYKETKEYLEESKESFKKFE